MRHILGLDLQAFHPLTPATGSSPGQALVGMTLTVVPDLIGALSLLSSSTLVPDILNRGSIQGMDPGFLLFSFARIKTLDPRSGSGMTDKDKRRNRRRRNYTMGFAA